MPELNTHAYTFEPSGLKPFRVAEASTPYVAEPFGKSIGLGETGVSLVEQLRRGLAFSAFEKLQKALHVPATLLCRIVHIPVRTLNRRRQQGRFDVTESERIYRIAALFDHAKEVIGTDVDAATWLMTPARGLGHKTPLSCADTEPGAQEVHDLLGRIEHGVFT